MDFFYAHLANIVIALFFWTLHKIQIGKEKKLFDSLNLPEEFKVTFSHQYLGWMKEKTGLLRIIGVYKFINSNNQEIEISFYIEELIDYTHNPTKPFPTILKIKKKDVLEIYLYRIQIDGINFKKKSKKFS